jgi:DNA mismatch endonuclease (patch repair protein)
MATNPAGVGRDVSEIMRRVHSTGTTPELVLRKALRSKGIRFKTSPPDLPGKPDIILPKIKIAIFVDGDFWHGNQWRHRGFPSFTAQFKGANHKGCWISKMPRNVRRDFGNTAQLIDSDWRVLRFWETDVLRNLERCVEVPAHAVRRECNES